jgi:Ala-tRNA(Pro) deacylase
MNNIYSFLNINNIHYERFDHPGVFTCEQARELCPEMPGVSIKNLFLYDKRTEQHFLVVVSTEKRVDLKELKKILNVPNLSFASEERLQKYLGVTPGAVTILGLMNDTAHAVTVIFDTQLKNQTLQCHPLVNTATLAIPFEDIKKFLALTQHGYQFLDIPERNDE